MWQTIIGFIGGPVISGLIKAYQAKLAAGNTSEKIAADLASGEIAAQTSETAELTKYRIAELGYHWEPDKLLGYCVVVYFAKLLIWDKVLGLGTTDGLCKIGDNCWAGATANLIVGAYFAKRGFENIARIIKR